MDTQKLKRFRKIVKIDWTKNECDSRELLFWVLIFPISIPFFIIVVINDYFFNREVYYEEIKDGHTKNKTY